MEPDSNLAAGKPVPSARNYQNLRITFLQDRAVPAVRGNGPIDEFFMREVRSDRSDLLETEAAAGWQPVALLDLCVSITAGRDIFRRAACAWSPD